MSEQFQYANQTVNKLTIDADVSLLTGDKDAVTVKYVQNKFDALIGTSPALLDTIQEIASALNGDPNILNVLSTNLSSAISTEVSDRNTAIQQAVAQSASSISETTDSLQSQLTSEISNRNAAITTAVTTESVNRQNSVSQVAAEAKQANDVEVNERMAMDGWLNDSIIELRNENIQDRLDAMPKTGGTFTGSVNVDDYLNFGTRWRVKGSSDGKRLVFEYCQAGDGVAWKTAIPFIQSS